MELQNLREWFLENKRDLPWREDHSPYRVWVSEVMLQQTQAAVVIPYFLRWMDRFPTIKALAEAPIEEVMKLWEGLGYYSRARNLHEGAKAIVKNYQGIFPERSQELKTIKGIGPYTVGAIQSFAFHKKAAAVDGNVIRVVTRLLGIDDDMSKAKHQTMLQQKVYELLPDDEPWVISEALIELGATICKKKPLCSSCPMRRNCYAALHGEAEKYPVKTKSVDYSTLHRAVAVIVCDGSLLLQKRGQGEIMEGLYEFPYFDHQPFDSVIEEIKNKLSLEAALDAALPKESHSFTRFRVHLYPAIYRAVKGEAINGYSWHPFKEIDALSFSSGHKRVLLSAQRHL